MSSVALPASASTQVLSAEADLVRQAARGDAEAFGELFRRHSAPAWRLAQAVTADRQDAVSVFRDGFVRAVKSGRFTRRVTTAFRPHVLSSVYRAAIDHAHDRATAPAPARRPAADSPEAALADAAFRSLPERWRAALWLSEVENLDAERMAGVLGVSASVAEQLVTRGRRGLAGRFSQAHRETPEHVGELLRSLALAAPANLADVTRSSWSTAGPDRLSLVAPVAGWLEDRAIRPMYVAVGALVGLGLVGLGVVPGGATVRSELSASSPSSLNGAVPTCMGLACPGGTTGAGGATGTAGAGGLYSSSGGFFTTSFASGSGGGFGGGGTTLTGFGSGSGATGSGYMPGGSTSGGQTPGQGPGGSTTPPTTTPPNPGSTPLVTLPGGLGSVGTTGSNLNTNVGGSGGLTLNAGTGGVTGSVSGTTLPTNSLTGSSGSSTGSGTTATTSGPTTTTTTTTLLQGVTGTVTQTVTTLLPGL